MFLFVNRNQQLMRCLLASVASVCVRSIQKLNMGIVYVSNQFVCSLSMAYMMMILRIMKMNSLKIFMMKQVSEYMSMAWEHFMIPLLLHF
jgi:hypothetical protein